MHFTIEEHIDSLKYHNHSHGMTMLEVLYDCKIDKLEALKEQAEKHNAVLETIRDILLDTPGTSDTQRIIRIINDVTV